MKKLMLSLCGFFVLCAQSAVIVDQLEFIVLGSEDVTPITYSDITVKRDISGNTRSAQEAISRAIMVQQAQTEKMVPDNSAFETFMERMNRQEGLTQHDVYEMFAEAGMTPEEGRRLLEEQYLQGVFQQRKVSSILAASESLLREEYEKNPVYQDAQYTFVFAKVPYTSDKKKQKIDLEKQLRDKKLSLDWSEEITLHSDQIAKSKRFITAMKVGEKKVVSGKNGFEIYWIKQFTPRRKKSLEECKAEIIAHINKENQKKAMEQYQKMVEKYYTVIPVGHAAE